jgi:hypothetical protein
MACELRDLPRGGRMDRAERAPNGCARTPSARVDVLMLPDFERADRIGEFWSYP